MTLLNARADVNAKSDSLQRTALHHAGFHGNTDFVEMLIRPWIGADINAQDINLATPAMLAAGQGYTNLANLLLSDGQAHPGMQDRRDVTANDYIQARANMPIDQRVTLSVGNVKGLRSQKTIDWLWSLEEFDPIRFI